MLIEDIILVLLWLITSETGHKEESLGDDLMVSCGRDRIGLDYGLTVEGPGVREELMMTCSF